MIQSARVWALLGLSLAWGLSSAACSQAGESGNSIDAHAEAVIERSRNTQGTYSQYSWNWVRDAEGRPYLGWSAEFHRGSLHRVETPEVRVVADCRARTGTWLNVTTNETQTGVSVANAACGANANPQVVALESRGKRESRFGSVDMVRLLDTREDRSYAVDADGVLIASEIFPRDSTERYCVQNEAVAVERTVPGGDIFSVDSLGRSVVAERYRAAPDRPAANLWLRGFSCR